MTEPLPKLYKYDADTGEYLHSIERQIDPAIKDKIAYLNPPDHCTDVEPPAASAGHVMIFSADINKWDEVEDHRGKTVYETAMNSETMTIQQLIVDWLGPIDKNQYTETAPPNHYCYFDPDKQKWINEPAAEKLHRRGLRNQYLQQTDWMIQRHQEQEQTQLQKTELTASDFNQILHWRQCLRDCLEVQPFAWPTLPPCLINHLTDYPQKTD